MKSSIAEKEILADYAFHFDALPQRIVFTNHVKITGWLLHRRGLPIHGIRGIIRGILRRRRIFRARRKRSRPGIAAAYPDLPEAGQSGFLLTLELPAGPIEITIQVQDDQGIWQTIFNASAWAFPLTFVRWIGLPRVEQFLVSYLSQLFLEREGNTMPALTPPAIHQSDGGLAALHKLQTPMGETNSMEDVKTVHLFVTSKSNLFIREIAELLRAGFRAAGCETELLVDQIPVEQTEPGKIQIVVTPHEFFNLFLRNKLPWERIQRLANHLFLLGTEQPESEWFDSNLVTAPHARAMLDIHPAGVVAYRRCGLRCFHLPLGYHPLLKQTDQPPKSARDIDICLLAAKTERREEFIAANADFFAARNCHLRLVPIEFAKTEETRSYLSASERNVLLQRSKILLNVHYSDLRYFEWHRALIAMSNSCCLITESCEGFEPLVPGKHFVMAKADDLSACCEYYLNNEREREEIAQAAHKFMRERFTQMDNCRAFLRQISEVFERQNALGRLSLEHKEPHKLPELTIKPIPNGLAKHLSQRALRSFVSALREDLANIFRPSDATVPMNSGVRIDPADMTQRIAIIRETRQGYVDRLDAQEKAEQNGEPVFQLIDNARVATSAPAISVIVTLYNYSAYIQQCIESLEHSNTAAIPGGVEIVIVNDASTDNSLERAVALQRISHHPVRIVDKRLNTGLADARNIGLQLARSRYVFILDADNMVFPRALEQLHAIAVKDNSAAVYSMLCRFEGAFANRKGLLSYFDWDSEMLIERPYIDAMAMFDRAQLINIGGYDTELFKFGWFGWEDYDLWLRIAEARLRVSFLPNVLCLYRHHQRSMTTTTNLFERQLVGRLIEKHRALVESYPPKSRILGVNRRWLEETPETTFTAHTEELTALTTTSSR